jgi:AcrR family transcriptional regulator
MPYPSLISPQEAVERARTIIETEGLDALSLAHLASALGVKAPSLYRHFESKSALLRAVINLTVREMASAMSEARGETAYDQLTAIAHAYRTFAHRWPLTYSLTFANLSEDLRPDEAELEGIALPLQALMAQIVGEEHAHAALRGVQSLIHGYVMLELNGQFRRGGDLDAHFARVVAAYLRGWEGRDG